MERGEAAAESEERPEERAVESEEAAQATGMAIFQQRPPWARSEWRYPSNRGEVPRYMQKAFRLKTFGLMSLQLLLVLLIAVPLRQLHLAERLPCPHEMEKLFRQGVVYIFGVFNLTSLLLLHCYQDRYPANYLPLPLRSQKSCD